MGLIQTYSCLVLKMGGARLVWRTTHRAMHAFPTARYLKVTIHWPRFQLSLRNDVFISQSFATLDLVMQVIHLEYGFRGLRHYRYHS